MVTSISSPVWENLGFDAQDLEPLNLFSAASSPLWCQNSPGTHDLAIRALQVHAILLLRNGKIMQIWCRQAVWQLMLGTIHRLDPPSPISPQESQLGYQNVSTKLAELSILFPTSSPLWSDGALQAWSCSICCTKVVYHSIILTTQISTQTTLCTTQKPLFQYFFGSVTKGKFWLKFFLLSASFLNGYSMNCITALPYISQWDQLGEWGVVHVFSQLQLHWLKSFFVTRCSSVHPDRRAGC